MSNPVEIEFSGNMTVPEGESPQFHVVQLRPMVLSHEREELTIDDVAPEHLVCSSSRVLGNGIVIDIRDILVVDRDRFDRSSTVEIAREVKMLDLELTGQNRPYLLVGIGRWGSADHEPACAPVSCAAGARPQLGPPRRGPERATDP